MSETQVAERAELVADGLVNVAQAATFLGVSRTRVYGLMDTGELAYVKLGKSRRIPKRALVELAAGAIVARANA